YQPDGPEWTVEYEIDVSRDLNGVGLLYFASYFAIVDWALLRLWRRLGRSDADFLGRVLLDQQLCCLGNADGARILTAALRRYRPTGGGAEAVNIVLRERETGRVLAVCTQVLGKG